MGSPPQFHISQFETPVADTPRDGRSLFKEPAMKEITETGPNGAYKFTVDDNHIAEDSTRTVFRREYQQTLLTELFFSEKNVNNIQDLLRYIINKQIGVVIDKQSPRELLVIMRAVFLEYSQHPPLPTDQSDPKLFKMYTDEVFRLNEIVVNECVPRIQSQIQQYIGYIKDISTQPMPMAPPQNVNSKGQRQYRSVTQVLTGGDL
ncbi:hypothetical protein EB118_12270 [bacterium]|nr:hypothetical protein [bacterium]NDD83470.1 hypothetical protein [bacterium]NDG30833.1 hypothetical protein [bacterium]